MSLLYVMSLLAAGLFVEQRTFISVINLSIQNIQSNAACRRTSTCLFVSVQIGHSFSKEMCIFLSLMEFLYTFWNRLIRNHVCLVVCLHAYMTFLWSNRLIMILSQIFSDFKFESNSNHVCLFIYLSVIRLMF